MKRKDNKAFTVVDLADSPGIFFSIPLEKERDPLLVTGGDIINLFERVYKTKDHWIESRMTGQPAQFEPVYTGKLSIAALAAHLRWLINKAKTEGSYDRLRLKSLLARFDGDIPQRLTSSIGLKLREIQNDDRWDGDDPEMHGDTASAIDHFLSRYPQLKQS